MCGLAHGRLEAVPRPHSMTDALTTLTSPPGLATRRRLEDGAAEARTDFVDAVVLYRVSDSRLVVHCVSHADPSAQRAIESTLGASLGLPLDGESPQAQVVRRAQTWTSDLHSAGADALGRALRAAADPRMPASRHSLALVPIPGPEGAAGVLAFVSDEPGFFDNGAIERSVERARRLGVALAEVELSHLIDADRRLHELSSQLAVAGSIEEAVRTVARLGLPAMGADAGTVGVVQEASLELLATEGFRADQVEGWRKIPLSVATPLTDAARDGCLVHVGSRAEFRRRYPDIAPAIDESAHHSWTALPVPSSDNSTVAAVVGFAYRSEIALDSYLRVQLNGLAHVARGTVNRALLERDFRLAATSAGSSGPRVASHEVPPLSVEVLQRSPAHSPLGGDWYSVLARDEPRRDVLVALGDVVGHGPAAVGARARVQSVFEAYALDGKTVLEAVNSTNAALPRLDITSSASLWAATWSESDGVLAFVNAGHPPPVLVRDGETPVLLEDRHGPLLGADGADYASTSLTLETPWSLVVYSDGLIERPQADLDDRVERVRRAIAGGGLSRLDELLAWMGQESFARDDVTVMRIDAPAPGGRSA